MTLKKFAAIAALALFFNAPAFAWVVSDKYTDVYTSSGTDLFAARRVRHNVQANEDEPVWEVFSRSAPGKAVMGMAFKNGKLDKHWEWNEAFQVYPNKEGMIAVLRAVGGDTGKATGISESSFRSLIIKKLNLKILPPEPSCGATLVERPTGYHFTVKGFEINLPWDHANSAGKPFIRGPDRCYETPAGILGVIVSMKGTVIPAPEKGAATQEFPDFSTEIMVWTIEPPKS